MLNGMWPFKFKPWTQDEILARCPSFLYGAEGEGDGGGEGAGGSGTTTPPPAGDSSGSNPPANDPDTFDREYVVKLRGENASHRTRNKELEDKLAEFEKAEAERKKAEMSEVERATAELNEEKSKRENAEKALVNERKRNAIISEASKLRFRDPEDALAHIDLDSIQVTETGAPHKTSIEAAVKKIAEEKKYLIDGPGSADGGARGTTPPPADALKAIQDDISARGGVPVG